MRSNSRFPIFQPIIGFMLVISLAFIGLSNIFASQGNGMPDCLYAGPGDTHQDDSRHFLPKKHSECKEDVLAISSLREVQETERMLGLRPDQINFIGCAAAPFMTYPASIDPPYRVNIFYPLKSNLTVGECLAPILHEIGHAYQYSHAGSTQRLLDSLQGSRERIELGADFLAGLAAQRLKINPGEFETSTYLGASYYAADQESHGNPEDRASAFRYGYKFPNAGTFDDSQYADFQDNGFGLIKHMGAPQ